jgi:hypothetical protein
MFRAIEVMPPYPVEIIEDRSRAPTPLESPPKVGVVYPVRSIEPAPDVSKTLFCRARLLRMTSVPSEINVLPEKVLASLNLKVPFPVFVKP